MVINFIAGGVNIALWISQVYAIILINFWRLEQLKKFIYFKRNEWLPISKASPWYRMLVLAHKLFINAYLQIESKNFSNQKNFLFPIIYISYFPVFRKNIIIFSNNKTRPGAHWPWGQLFGFQLGLSISTPSPSANQ